MPDGGGAIALAARRDRDERGADYFAGSFGLHSTVAAPFS